MSAHLILVRHGQTDWNVEGRYQGQSGPGLNEQGMRQAQAVAEQMREFPVVALYSSDLPRAVGTARIIGEVLALSINTDARLREISQGCWQGMLYLDIQRQYADALQQFRADPVSNSPPGGESLAALSRRFLSALDAITHRFPDRHVIIVTHKLPIALVTCLSEGRSLSRIWDAIPQNAEYVTLEWPLPTIANTSIQR